MKWGRGRKNLRKKSSESGRWDEKTPERRLTTAPLGVEISDFLKSIIDVKYQYMVAMNMAIVVDECTKATAVQMNSTPITETPHHHLEKNHLEET